MRKTKKIGLVLTVLAMLIGVLFLQTSAVSAADDTRASYFIILFKNKVPDNLDAQVASFGGSVEFTHDIGLAIVKDVNDVDLDGLKSIKGVKEVVNGGVYAFDPGLMSTEPMAVSVLPESPEDPTLAARYAWQWNMRAIDADDAWATGRLGSSDVTVAILDTGIDYTYPDLAGLVDLERSVSFVPEDDVYVSFYFPGKHPVTDIHYHGTHVAATVSSNGLVAAGVTSQTTLMGVKVCSAVLGYCPGEAIVAGILHAVDNGADVINMSLGGGFLKNEEPGYVSLVNTLINYANRHGVTIVVSAGNDAIDLDHSGALFSTYCDAKNTVCASATGPTSSDDFYEGPWYDIDAPADYTNYGSSAIDVAAPGGNSGGYVWAACSQTSLVIPGCQTGVYIVGLAGTSMAAPHVSGTAALLVEDLGSNPGRIKTQLQISADDLGDPGVDPFYGKGRINVYNAVN